MKSKEEAVQEAYREWWPAVKEYVDENGWFFKDNFAKIDLTYEDMSATVDFIHDHSTDEMIPKEIHGIRENNGWIRIECKDDLPERTGKIFWVMKKGYTYPIIERFYNHDNEHWLENYTHYRIVETPELPVY